MSDATTPHRRDAHHTDRRSQPSPDVAGQVRDLRRPGREPDMSFLEMLDIVNERLMHDGKEPIAFDHDWSRGHLRARADS